MTKNKIDEIIKRASSIADLKKQSIDENLLEITSRYIDDIRSNLDELEDKNWGGEVLDDIPSIWNTTIEDMIISLNTLRDEGIEVIGA